MGVWFLFPRERKTASARGSVGMGRPLAEDRDGMQQLCWSSQSAAEAVSLGKGKHIAKHTVSGGERYGPHHLELATANDSSKLDLHSARIPG